MTDKSDQPAETTGVPETRDGHSATPAPPQTQTPDESCRLFVGNLPKVMTENDIYLEVGRVTDGLVRVITYKNFENPSLHRGFCFLDYGTTAAAARAKQLLASCTVFGCKTIVDWADPEPEIDERTMANVRILFVRQYGGALDEAALTRVFGQHGAVERVKTLKNYAFVHFERRDDAQDALNALDSAVDADSGVRIEVSWAKPPTDKRDRERTLRDRERRMRQAGNTSWTTGAVTAATTAVADVSAAAAAAPTGVPASYHGYDHYVYDFDCAPLGCTCGRQQRQPHCPRADVAVRDAGKCDAACLERPPRTPDGAAHDRGDCADLAAAPATNLDDNVLKFFYKLTNGYARNELKSK